MWRDTILPAGSFCIQSFVWEQKRSLCLTATQRPCNASTIAPPANAFVIPREHRDIYIRKIWRRSSRQNVGKNANARLPPTSETWERVVIGAAHCNVVTPKITKLPVWFYSTRVTTTYSDTCVVWASRRWAIVQIARQCDHHRSSFSDLLGKEKKFL